MQSLLVNTLALPVLDSFTGVAIGSKYLLNGDLKILEDLGVLPGRQLVIEANGERFSWWA